MRRPRKLTIAALIAVAAVAIPTAAQAIIPIIIGDPGATTYTGCLKPTGSIYQVAQGSSPKVACLANETPITLAGGDITSVVTGAGITGGGQSGDVPLGLATNYQLPQNCVGGSVPKAKGANAGWSCGVDYGRQTYGIGTLSVDTPGAHDYCPDGANFSTSATNSFDTSAGPTAVAAGTYRPSLTAATKWQIFKTDDLYGDSRIFGSVKIDLVRIRAGVQTTVTTWARTKSEQLESPSLLGYDQDFGSFTAQAGDTFFMRVTAFTSSCGRASLFNAGINLDRVG